MPGCRPFQRAFRTFAPEPKTCTANSSILQCPWAVPATATRVRTSFEGRSTPARSYLANGAAKGTPSCAATSGRVSNVPASRADSQETGTDTRYRGMSLTAVAVARSRKKVTFVFLMHRRKFQPFCDLPLDFRVRPKWRALSN